MVCLILYVVDNNKIKKKTEKQCRFSAFFVAGTGIELVTSGL